MAAIQLETGLPADFTALKSYKFKLKKGGAEQEFEVDDIKGSDHMTAKQKAKKIYDKVREKLDEGWDAVYVDDPAGTKLRFRHREGTPAEWVYVDEIVDITDETGEADTIKAIDSSTAMFEFGLDDTLAAGEAYCDKSFVSVATSLGTASVQVRKGDSAQSVISALTEQLCSRKVEIVFSSGLAFQIIDKGPNPFMKFQVTDIDLVVMGAGGQAT